MWEGLEDSLNFVLTNLLEKWGGGGGRGAGMGGQI